jgi:hypothetical protein
MSLFFKFAKPNCCNYSPAGPCKKADYCWLEPKETASVCLLASGNPRNWFREAVLPMDKALKAEWQRLHMLKSDPHPMPGNYRICQCGVKFRFTSNRQLWCPTCTDRRRSESMRKRNTRRALTNRP